MSDTQVVSMPITVQVVEGQVELGNLPDGWTAKMSIKAAQHLAGLLVDAAELANNS